MPNVNRIDSSPGGKQQQLYQIHQEEWRTLRIYRSKVAPHLLRENSRIAEHFRPKVSKRNSEGSY